MARSARPRTQAKSGVEIWVDDTHVQRMVTGLELSLSGISLTRFLLTNTMPYLQQRMGRRIRAGGDEASGKWVPLARYTVAQRQAKGLPSGPPMYATGSLHDFLTHSPGAAAPDAGGATMMLPGDPTDLGGEWDALKMAQRGLDPNPIPGFRPVPPRPILVLSVADLMYTLSDLHLFILDTLHSRMGASISGDLGSAPFLPSSPPGSAE